jgi:hypothetical protein
VDLNTRRALKRKAHELAARVPDVEMEGKTPGSVCSGIVSNAVRQEGVKLSKRALAESCNVSSATLDKMTKAVALYTTAPA